MSSPLLSRTSLTVALLAVVAVGAVIGTSGGAVFSPGGLHAGDSTTLMLGGVTSHAALAGDCSSCHAALFSGSTMRTRCVECHTDIQAEWRDSTTLHGAFASTVSCKNCHTEHRGATGELTSFAGLGVEHARFGFPLDGSHVSVACADCHQLSAGKLKYRDTPSTCVGCHQKDDTHNGSYGNDCASCHNTNRWEDATFDHAVFPITHGEDEEGKRSSCSTCHTNKSDYKVYTCYGCHAHTPQNVEREHRGEVDTRDLADCVRCHAGGREDGERGGEGRRNGRRERDGDGLASLAGRSFRLAGKATDVVRAYQLTLAR